MEYIYAALLLHKSGKEITEENIKKVIAASGGEVNDAKVKSMIASLKDVDIDKELESASLMTAAPSAGHAPVEEKKQEKKEEHAPAAEGLSALFG